LGGPGVGEEPRGETPPGGEFLLGEVHITPRGKFAY